MPPPPNQAAFRGASLYSGIFDQQDDPQGSTSTPQQDGPSGSAPTQIPPSTSKASEAGASSSKSDSSATDATKTTGWSAALRFAPRKTAAAAKAKARPNAAFVASFTASASSSASEVAEESVPKGALSRAPGVAPKPLSAPYADKADSTVKPDLGARKEGMSGGTVDTSDLNLTALALPSADNDDTHLISKLTKYPVVEAPPFTLPPDQVEREKMLIRQSNAAAGRQWNEEENDVEREDEEEDVNGFLSTNAGRRAAKGKQRKRKRGSPPAGPNMNAEYDPRVPNDYMAYKAMVYERRKAQLEHERWMHEQEEAEGWDEEEEEEEEETTRHDRFPPPPALQSMSNQAQKEELVTVTKQPLTGEEAFARRVVMSSAPAPTQALTGEEAYQRRLALSGEEAYQRRVAMSQQPASTTLQTAATGPRSGLPPGPPPGPPPARPSATQPAGDLASRQNVAAAIAARLAQHQPAQPASSSSPNPTPVPPQEREDTRSFAERYMSASGYVPGQGIGAAGNKGITTPLTLTQNPSSKKGSIINPHQTAQQQQDLAKFGPPSRIIVLLNMITPQDLTGDKEEQELMDDISTECGKYGIVKRIFPHAGEKGQVSVFVEFTGQAGSWKAVRGLEARWFEGRQVKAFYYDEDAFERRDYGLLLTRPQS